MKTVNQRSMNEKHAITCRRLSRVMLWLSTVFLIILQVMGFFVAVNAGYEKSLALALSCAGVSRFTAWLSFIFGRRQPE